MAYYRCGGGVPSSVKTLPTYKTASGSVATFETDMTENLISCIADIVATQSGSGIPSPSNSRPISGHSSCTVTANSTPYVCNLGDTYYGGSVDVVTGKLRLTHGIVLDMSQLSWTVGGSSRTRYDTTDLSALLPDFNILSVSDITCEVYPTNSAGNLTDKQICAFNQGGTNYVRILNSDYVNDTAGFTSSLSGKKLVYELATPIELDVYSVQIPTLNGTNNLFADTGNISEAKYILSVGEALRQS